MSDDFSSPRFEQTAQHLVGDSGELRRNDSVLLGNRLAVLLPKLLLGLIVFEIPIQLDTYLNHSLEVSKFGAISGFNFSITTFCLILLYVQWLPRLVVESKRMVTSRTATAYVGISALSILWSVDRSRTLFQIFLMLQAFMIFVYLTNHLKTRRDIFFVVSILMAGLAFQTTMMSIVYAIRDDINFGPVTFHYITLNNRLAGSLASPNVASSYLAFLIAPCFCLFLVPISRKAKLLAGAFFLLACFSLIFTMSRGGWGSAAVSMMLVVGIAFRQRWLSPRVFAVFLFLGMIVAVSAFPLAAKRIFQDDGGSAMSRVPLMEISRQIILENPLGVGANNWGVAAEGIAEKARFRAEWFYLVHNKYLLVWSETGWLGLAAFLSMLGAIMLSGWRAIRLNDRWLSPIALGFSAAMFGEMLHMGVDVFNSRVQVQLFFLIAAIIIATSNLLIRENLDSVSENLSGSNVPLGEAT